jgi:hypothetical protein
MLTIPPLVLKLVNDLVLMIPHLRKKQHIEKYAATVMDLVFQTNILSVLRQ